MQKNYLYAAGGLLLAAAVTAGLVWYSEHRKPGASAGTGAAAESAGLSKPRAIAFGTDGSLYIVDSKNNRIEKRNAAGQMTSRFGRYGSGEGQLREPCGIAIAQDGSVFVADTFHTLDPNGALPWGRVEKFTAEGGYVASFGKVPVAPNDLFGPRGIAVDKNGNVFMSDTGNHRVLKYSSQGAFMKAWGKRGKANSEFAEPFGITVDQNGRVYVADRLNYRVQVFSNDGAYISQFKVNGWEETQINQEPYLAIDDKKGTIFVSDPTKGKVLKYSLSGQFIKSYDTALEGKLSQPTGLAVRESDGMLFISDGNLARIMTLKP